MRILTSVLVRLPLILAGLLPVVSLGGVLTMRDAATVSYAPLSGDGIGSPIAAGCERADVTGSGVCLDELDERSAADGGAGSVGGPGEGAAGTTPDLGEGNVAGAPGKSEEANGDATPSGSGDGAGQQRADESGEGPHKADDKGVDEGKDRQGSPSEP